MEVLDQTTAAFYPRIYAAVKTIPLLNLFWCVCAAECSFTSMKRIKTLLPVTCLQKSRPDTRDYFLFIDLFFFLDRSEFNMFYMICKAIVLGSTIYEIISNHHIDHVDENQFLHTNPRTNPMLQT